MTRDEILNMPACDKLDFLIAQNVMNLSFHDVPREGGGTYNSFWDLNKHYSTDIAAAWEVVEILRKSFWLFSVVADDHIWSCDLGRYDGSHTRIRVSGDTAPLAICRAALLAILERV